MEIVEIFLKDELSYQVLYCIVSWYEEVEQNKTQYFSTWAFPVCVQCYYTRFYSTKNSKKRRNIHWNVWYVIERLQSSSFKKREDRDTSHK